VAIADCTVTLSIAVGATPGSSINSPAFGANENTAGSLVRSGLTWRGRKAFWNLFRTRVVSRTPAK